MAFSFHQAGMGTKLLAQLSPPLAQALEQIAQSLPKNFEHEFRSVPTFFYDFIDGFWTPFEEVCQANIEGLRKASQAILTPDLLAMHSQPSGTLFVSQVGEKGRWNISAKNYA